MNRQQQAAYLTRLTKAKQNSLQNKVERFITECKDKTPIQILHLFDVYNRQWMQDAERTNKTSTITVLPDAFYNSIKRMYKRIDKLKPLLSDAEYWHYSRVADICADKTLWYKIRKWLKEHFFVKSK